MDGRRLRRFRRWWLCGGLVVGGVGCHKQATFPDNGLPKPGQAVTALLPPGQKPMGGGSAAAPPVANGMPVPVATTPKKGAPKPLSAEAEAALADVHVASALGDQPPPNRDELLDLARQRYQRALKAEPRNKAALLGLARMYAGMGDRDRAVEAYKRYLDLHPKDHETAFEVAVAHARWKDWGGSAAWCDVAIRVDPENRTYRKHQGFCLARAGRWDEGFQALCRVMPEAQARLNIAGLLDHLQYPEQSRQWAAMALQVDPGYAPARDFLVELDQAARGGAPAAADPGPNPGVVRVGYTRQP